MKRNWDLVRALLIRVKDDDTSVISNYSDEEVGFHFKLLVPDYILTEDGIGLTPKGLELCDELRDERKYNLAMKEIEAAGFGASTEILAWLIKRIA